MEAGTGSVLCQDEGSVKRDKEGWKNITAHTHKRSPSLSSKILLQNRYKTLGRVDKAHKEIEGEPMQADLHRSETPTPCKKNLIKTIAKKKQQPAMAIS